MQKQIRRGLWAARFAALFWYALFKINAEAHAQGSASHLSTPAALLTNHLWLAPPRALKAGLGFTARAQWQAPVSGLQGDLYGLPALRADFGISSHVVLQIRGAAQQVLAIDEAASRPAPGIPASGTTHDAGDFSVATMVRLWENQKQNLAFGFSIETQLPNSTQRKGIGTNTTDVLLAALASKKWNAGAVFGNLGMGILTAPLETDEQNDVLLYGLGMIWQAHPHGQLFAEVTGYATTRNVIPVGTEARSIAAAGAAWQLGAWGIEGGMQYGLTSNEGKWGGMLVLTRSFSW